MGVWIEIVAEVEYNPYYEVTPCVGVWIEMSIHEQFLPDWDVTPCVGVWIEIACPCFLLYSASSHSLRGSVD